MTSFLGSVFGNSIVQTILISSIQEGFVALNAIVLKTPQAVLLAPELQALEASFQEWLNKFLKSQTPPASAV